MDISAIMQAMTAEEKAALVSGTDFMYTNEIPRLNLPFLCMADGPHGLRKQASRANTGVADSEPSTAFPTAATTACSWNPENTRRMGEAIGRECRHYGVHLLLGPGVNIKRNPLCGRNFEYFSEDPLLTAEMAITEIKGLKSQGVGCAVKHFALNNNENYRFVGDSIADERAKREIYLRAFERIIKEADPATLMCAYNRVDGEYCSQNKTLLTDILRDEWGFSGAVMTDWGAMHDRVASLHAGLDLEMPGDAAICRRWILDGLRDGSLPPSILDRAVENILRVINTYAHDPSETSVDWEAHHALAADIATDSAVLLKNDHGALPLDPRANICVIGELFDKMRYQGSGSSMVNATEIVTPRRAFDVKGITYTYARGYQENSDSVEQALIDEAVLTAAPFEGVLVFAGLTDLVESESGDREDMRLPENQTALIDALAAAGKRITLVLFGGSPIELPFYDSIEAILHMYLPGQNGGTAVCRLLFGDAVPSGRLAESWPLTYAAVPFGDEYNASAQSLYKESVFVGYRYYAGKPNRVRFPFGYGLSYTTFAYSDMHLTRSEDSVLAECRVTNTGSVDACEVLQLYTSAPSSDVFKPMRELRAFRKIHLKAGESKQVVLSVPIEDLRYYHITQNAWVLESGTYTFSFCRDSEHAALEQSIALCGNDVPSPYDSDTLSAYRAENIAHVTDEQFSAMCRVPFAKTHPTLPITVDSRFDQFKETRGGRLIYRAVFFVIDSMLTKAKRMPRGQARDNKIKEILFTKRILESNSMCCMSMNAGGLLPYNVALAAVALANGKIGSMIRHLTHPIKVPKLPRKQ